MSAIRLIARLDIKSGNLIKGVHLEGLRVIGAPHEHAVRYYQQGADELIYIDTVASLYGRNSLNHVIEAAAKDIFIPITVGGGIRSADDARALLRSGADKIAVNTAAVANPQLIAEIAREFGSQCMVLSVQARQIGTGRWEVLTDNGRERTGLDVMAWIRQGVDLGAGEVLLTSVDREGTRTGFDVDLIRAAAALVPVPLIASGGMGKAEDLIEAAGDGAADAVAMADILHYGRATIGTIRETARAAGLSVRRHVH